MTATRIVRVAIDTPLRRVFDYRAPPGATLHPGQRVRVPFGRRSVIGWVTGTSDASDWSGPLKPLGEVLDPEPLWDAALWATLGWTAEYYHHPLGEVLAGALPVPLRNGAPLSEPRTAWRWSDSGRAERAGTKRLGRKQQALAAALDAGDVDAALLEQLDARDALRGFVQRGWVASFEPPLPGMVREHREPTTIAPTAAQQAAIDGIAPSIGQFAAHLLHGVTGSGKTEVYLRLIEQVLARGEQALVLVPEIALTPQLLQRFRARLPVPVVALHSGLNDGERLQAWREAREGRAPVVIGTRSGVFVPLPRPGLVIVDEEHDLSYKQQDGLRYSARDLAVVRARRHGVPIVLGSATPSLETLANARAGRYQWHSLPDRAGAAVKPRLAIVDLRVHSAKDGLATPSIAAIERHLAARGQVLVYLNRRGYAPTLYCTSCGWMAPCAHCDARMTVHMRRAALVCHHCGAEAPLPYACPTCNGEVRPVGEGTERVEAALAALFPHAPAVRIDRDRIRRRGEIEAALDEVGSGRARLMIGTQMVTKGHDFPNVTLVVVLNADQGLFGADFRAAERLAQQIVQVAGRAGRGDRPGEVLIQTAFPEHPLLTQLLSGGYDAFATAALAEREQAGWPPSSYLALVRAEAEERPLAMGFLEAARAELVRAATAEVRLLGPASATMERRGGRFRAQLLLESRERGPLHRALDAALPGIEALPDARRVRWSLDIDPLEVD